MSTRALYTFICPGRKQDTFHVYKHHDGYPKGAAEAIANALPLAWQLPRFEADEFAAAFVAGNKSHYLNRELELLRKLEQGEVCLTSNAGPLASSVPIRSELAQIRDYAKNYNGGGVRLMHTGSVYAVAPGDIEYRYEITLVKSKLQVTAYKTDFWDVRIKANEKRIYKGKLE